MSNQRSVDVRQISLYDRQISFNAGPTNFNKKLINRKIFWTTERSFSIISRFADHPLRQCVRASLVFGVFAPNPKLCHGREAASKGFV
jgi:hypothetical protein